MALGVGQALQGIGSIVGALQPAPYSGAVSAQAMQPGLQAAEQYGLWGPAAQQSAAYQTSWVFMNQSPAALATLTAPDASAAAPPLFAGNLIPREASTTPSLSPWVLVVAGLILLFLILRHRGGGG